MNCSCCRRDFFLVNQSVNQGTVSPTHYTVLYNSTGIELGLVQQLTYKLCHLYFNWSVSTLRFKQGFLLFYNAKKCKCVCI